MNDLQYKTQVEYINKIYMEIDISLENFIWREIENKTNGYKHQDQLKNILDLDLLISPDSIIEKLVESKLKCYYCKCNTCVLYDVVRQKNQWTLDRIDNDIGHNTDNVVISCLECNLKRRRINMERFKFSKECVNIKKVG